MNQKELAGGSYHWWPPEGDHVILYKANPLRFTYFDRFVSNYKNLKVLDVGCGGGYACEFLAKRGAAVSGADILNESLLQAREHAAENNLEIDYRLCTQKRLPFEDNTMDCVICFDVLEHVKNKNITLSEIYRVLKPGGWLFFDTFNKTFWSKLFAIWIGEIIVRFIPTGTHDWELFIRPDDLKCLLEKSGFVNKGFAGIRFSGSSWSKGGLPVKISESGSTSLIYFGAAKKPG